MGTIRNFPTSNSFLNPNSAGFGWSHRLDKGTSGVIVLARNPESHRRLNQAFREREVHKNYHGLIWPVPEWTEQVIDSPLKVTADRRHRTRVNLEQGKPAWTPLCHLG